jgi:glycosyltransferase involved in cell wall biosynthesis
MKVLFLTFAYPTPENVTAGIFVKEHARAASRAAEVAVVHLDRGGGRFSIEETSDDEFRAIRVRYPRSKLAYALHFVGALRAFRRLQRTGFDPDVIHAHFFPAALPPLLLRPLFRKPVVVTEQWSVFLPEDPATLSPLMLRVARAALARAERVMPASDALRRGMVAQGIVARYRVVPNVVDTTLFKPGTPASRTTRTLLFVGLLYDAKGVDLLLEAVALLAERGDFRLEIVGDGPLRREYERLCATLGLGHVVSFLGLLPKPEVARRMSAADVFVLTSRFDNNPCVLIEAQASGLPAVATPVGGIPEIVDERAGVLAESGHPASIAAALEAVLEHLDRFDRKAISQRATARFGTEAIGETLAAIYAEALSA